MSRSTEKTILFIFLIILSIFLIYSSFPALFFFFEAGGPNFFSIHRLPFLLPAALPFLLLLVIWIFIIVWVYRDAERRGMNGILWALLVFFGNFVGLLIYLIVRNEGMPVRTVDNQKEPCPNCGKMVSQSYAFCPHCGTRLKAVCPNCEKLVSPDWKVCPYCGEKLATSM